MFLRFAPIAGLLILLIFPVAYHCTAQSRTSLKDWISIFDGKDLHGWHETGVRNQFSPESGSLIAGASSNGGGQLVTDQPYRDFMLEMDFMADSSIRAGILVRSEDQSGDPAGYQVAIDPAQGGWTGAIRESTAGEWLYPLTLDPPARKAFHPGAWNHLDVECIGSTIRTWINGIPASNLEDSSRSEGFISLYIAPSREDTPGKIRFRRIRVCTARLQARPLDQIFVVNHIPNSLSPQEQKNGWQLLWDGKTTTGWRGIFRTAFPTEGWEIHDGVLTIHASNGHEEGSGGDLVTDREFQAFDLQFEFKYTEMANSGVKYDVKESYNPGGKSGIGLEYQILDDAHHPDAKLGRNGDRTLSSLYDLIPRKDIPEAFRPIGAWNRGRIIVYPDNHTEHWLNGYKMLQYEKGSREFLELVAISKYKVWKNFGRWKEGHILLQDHGTEVSFRSIKIKVL